MTAPSFVLQQSGTTARLNHVYGFGPSLVVAVGDGGTILTWNGQQWIKRQSGTVQNLTRVWGATAAPGTSGPTMWAVGSGGVFLQSTDGAASQWHQVNTLLGAAAGVSPGALPLSASGAPTNLGAIWGISAKDFWTIDQTSGVFWHTRDGGNSVAGWTAEFIDILSAGNRMWGDGFGNIIAINGGTGPAAVAALYWSATGAWERQAYGGVPIGRVFDAWPHTATGPGFFGANAWLVGQSPTGSPPSGPTGGQISDWNTDLTHLSYTLDAVPSGALLFSAVYGADTTNLYAAGVGYTSQPFLAQIVPPAGNFSATSSWAAVPMPPGMPGGLNSVYAGPSGYAVTVGAFGGIAATPGYILTVQGAAALSTNTVEVTLTNIPLAMSPVGTGDALNPASWTITRSDTGVSFTPLAVLRRSPVVFDIIVAERFGPASVPHLVTAALVDPFGNAIGTQNSGVFFGTLADTVATQDAVAAANNFAISDLANPPFPIGSNVGGARVITAAGDFASTTGNDLLRKLIIRRLTTATNGFFHLPGYGLGLDPKSPVRATDMISLKKRIQDQVALEPEVVTVDIDLELDAANGILMIQGKVKTNLGQTVLFETTVQTPAAAP